MNSNHLSIHVNHFIWTHIKPYHSIHINSSQSHTTFSKKIVLFFCSIARNFCISKITWLSQKRHPKVPGGGRHSSLKVLPLTPIWGPPNMEEKHTRIQFLRTDERRRHTELWGSMFVPGWKKSETDCQERVFKVVVLNIRLCQNFATKKHNSWSILRDFHCTVYVT